MEKSSQVFTVFYAWQSDRMGSHCRHLIRRALDEAADLLSADESQPYRIAIDQDTQGVAGLCDIPATILSKIASADAVVADLTFVSKTRPLKGKKPKYCSNPNVLFELGYAFHALTHERLICVMNEAHGASTETLFDLDHRRHPIAFDSKPDNSISKRDVIKKLSQDIANALRPIVAKGPRSIAIDNNNRHQVDRTRIQSFRNEAFPVRPSSARLTTYIYPLSYINRRWNGWQPLLAMLESRAIRVNGHRYPFQQTDTNTMGWGLYNGIYGEQWSITYAGLFWFQEEITANYQGPEITSRIERLTNKKSGSKFENDEWIALPRVLESIVNTHKFIASYINEFHKSERFVLHFSGEGMAGKWLLAE